MGAHDERHRRSLEDPEGFWAEAADAIDWETAPTRALDDSRAPFYRWYPDGVLNTCHNALDRHVDGGRAEQAALVYDCPVTGVVRSLTYRELRDETARFAGVLRSLGVGRGDTVVIYMPMVPEAVVAMLACARLGAVHSVVFGGFASAELAMRIDDARPTVVVTASCGIEVQRVVEYGPLLEGALQQAEHTRRRVRGAPAPRGRGAHAGRARRRLARGHGRRRAGRVRAGRRHRSALRALHLGHHRAAQGGGARQRRARGGAAALDGGHLRHAAPARSTGRRPTSAGWWATPTSSTRPSSPAAPRSSTRASPWAPPIPGRSGGSSRSTG